MGCFDDLAASSFKEDSRGRNVFYPWGIVGKGYVLKDKRQEEELKKFVKFYHMITLAALLIMGPFLQLWPLCLAFTLVAVIVWTIKVKRSVIGLPLSGERLIFGENYRNVSGNGCCVNLTYNGCPTCRSVRCRCKKFFACLPGVRQI